MKVPTLRQFTIRRVPAEVDRALRSRAKKEGKSINKILLESLSLAAGQVSTPLLFHDLDELAGTWTEDPEFDRAIEDQRKVDPELWKP